MKYVVPEFKQVLKKLTNNERLINCLEENGILVTTASLLTKYTIKEIQKMESKITLSNLESMSNLAKLLYENDSTIASKTVKELVLSEYLIDDIPEAFGMTVQFASDVYYEIFYCYKYCVTSSFFQNNIAYFLPEVDLNMLQSNEGAEAFVDATLKEYDRYSDILDNTKKFQRIEEIPDEYVNYFAQLLGIEKSTFGVTADEDDLKFREIVKNIIDIYSYKGTSYSIETFFDFMGIALEIKEFYFDRRYFFLKDGESNPETEVQSSTSFKRYLTTKNPICNVRQFDDDGDPILTKFEVVRQEDISTQYSLEEFDLLSKNYGAEAVLGYSDFDKNGNKYTGKVYKYFKSNYITYNPYRKDDEDTQLTSAQHTLVSKYRDFFTPLYIYSTIKYAVTDSSSTETTLGWDGDGVNWDIDKEACIGFRMLDGEAWDPKNIDNIRELLIYTDSNGIYYEISDNGELREYESSIGETKIFRIPIGNKRVHNISLNKNLGRMYGVNYLTGMRVRDYYNDANCHCYDIPPTQCCNSKWYTTYKGEDVGFSSYGETTIRTQLRDKGTGKTVDHVYTGSLCNQAGVNLFLATYDEYSHAEPVKVTNGKFNLVSTIIIDNASCNSYLQTFVGSSGTFSFKTIAEAYNKIFDFVNFKDTDDYFNIYTAEAANFGSCGYERSSNNIASFISSGDYIVTQDYLGKSVSIYRYTYEINPNSTKQYILSPLFEGVVSNASVCSSNNIDGSYACALKQFRLYSCPSSSNQVSRDNNAFYYRISEEGNVFAPELIGSPSNYSIYHGYNSNTSSKYSSYDSSCVYADYQEFCDACRYRILYSEDGSTFYTDSGLENEATIDDDELVISNSASSGEVIAKSSTTQEVYFDGSNYYSDAEFTNAISICSNGVITYIGTKSTDYTLYADSEFNYYTNCELTCYGELVDGSVVSSIEAYVNKRTYTCEIVYIDSDGNYYSDDLKTVSCTLSSSQTVCYNSSTLKYYAVSFSDEEEILYYNEDSKTYYTDSALSNETTLKSTSTTATDGTITATEETLKYFKINASITYTYNGMTFSSIDSDTGEFIYTYNGTEYKTSDLSTLNIYYTYYSTRTLYYDGISSYYTSADMESTTLTAIADNEVISSTYTAIKTYVGREFYIGKIFSGLSSYSISKTASAYEDFEDNGLYKYVRNKYAKGDLIYSIADQKLYKIKNFGPYGIEEVTTSGRVEVTMDDSGNYSVYIYDYDPAWDGPSEENDEEDFIFYNTNHEYDWSAVGESDATSDRPVKYFTDDKITDDVALALIKEICQKTGDSFTGAELKKLNDEE